MGIHDSEAYLLCLKCKEMLPEARFNKNRARKNGLSAWCKACWAKKRDNEEAREYRKKKASEWYEKNSERAKNYTIVRNRELRLQALKAYSGEIPSCACCGELEIPFLALDHMDGKGAEHRRQIGTSIYYWTKINGYPPGFQVLCHNCNLAKGFYGICPHETKNAQGTGEPASTRGSH
jgi:hypothetical protein